MKPESCNACPYRDREGPVWGHGSPRAHLVTIAQNPWKAEWEARDNETGQRGIPLVGASGDVYNRACGYSGIDRTAEYTTNVVKCLVAPGEKVDPRAIACCRPLLDKELKMLDKATTILTLGQEAFDALTGKQLYIQHSRAKLETIRSGRASKACNVNPRGWLRGCPLPITLGGREMVIIPAAHPSYIMRTGFREAPILEADLVKAKRWSTGGGERIVEHTNYSPSSHEVQEYIREIIHHGEFGLDIETEEKRAGELSEDDLMGSMSEVQITVVGISANIGESVGVQPDMFPLLEPLLLGVKEKRPICYTFNGGYDLGHLAKYFHARDIDDFESGIEHFDCMLALNCMYSDVRPKDLATFISLYTDAIYSKNLILTDPDRYNAYDTFGVLWGGQHIRRALKHIGALQVFQRHDMPCVSVLEDMHTHGPRCDVDLAQRFELQCLHALSKYEAWWEQKLPYVSWTSPKQLVEFFKAQGFPVQYKTKVDKITKARTKVPTADEDALEVFRDTYKSQIAGLILEMRKLKKSSDFCRPYGPDGYAHSTYKLHGQVAGRIQSSNPDLQNIPERIGGIEPRRIITGDSSEDVIINADFAQVELMIYAWYANDLPLLEAKHAGTYIYGKFWEEWFPEKPPFFIPGLPKIKANINPAINPDDILFIKTAPLGLIYGRMADSLQTMGLTYKEALTKFNQFHKDHWAIGVFHRKVMDEVTRKGYAQNVFGRIRRFPNPKGQRPEILSFFGQNTGSDILKRNALIPLKKTLPDFGARLLLTVHDSVGICARRDNYRTVIEHVRETLEQPIPEMGGFTIGCDIKVGDDWGSITTPEKYEKRRAAAQDVPSAN